MDASSTNSAIVTGLSHIRPDMFQCMAWPTLPRNGEPLQMHQLFEALVQYVDKVDDREIYCVAARAPGSLGQSIPSVPDQRPTDWLIGSISMKVHLETTSSVYSVFIFATGQLKISGGSYGYTGTDDSTAYTHFLESTVLRPIFSIPVLSTFLGELSRWELCLLNGTTLLLDANQQSPFAQMGHYRQLCDNIADEIAHTGGHPNSRLIHVQLPPIMINPNTDQHIGHDPARVSYTYQRTSGRICSISIKCAPRGTIRFDHKGSVQFLGFRAIYDMGHALHALLDLLRRCNYGTSYMIHTLDTFVAPTRRPWVRRHQPF